MENVLYVLYVKQLKPLNQTELIMTYKTTKKFNKNIVFYSILIIYTCNKIHYFQVTFTLPILSSSLKDWLAYSNPAPSNTSDKQTISFPAMSSSNKEWLTGSTTADSISPLSSESTGSWQMTRDDPDVNIQMWLKDIKQNPVIEDEDDFEVISKKEFMGNL